MRHITPKQDFPGKIKATTVKLQNLRRKFENLFMQESESEHDFFSKMMQIVNQMHTNCETIEDKTVIEKLQKFNLKI